MAVTPVDFLRGVGKLRIATPGANGTVGTDWSELMTYGLVEDGVKANITEATINKIKVLGQGSGASEDYTSFVESNESLQFEFMLRGLSPALLYKLKGGTIGTDNSYTPPAEKEVSKSFSLQIVTPAENYIHRVIEFPLVKIVTGFDGSFKPTETFNVKCKADVQIPKDANDNNLPEFTMKYMPSAPTNLVANDTDNELSFDIFAGFLATDYEYTINGGDTWTAVTAVPIDSGLTGTITAADIIVRIAEQASYWSAGFETVATTGFTGA